MGHCYGLHNAPDGEKWEKHGTCWNCDNFKLSHVLFADDVLLVARSRKDLQGMIDDLEGALRKAGLQLSKTKGGWTAWPKPVLEGETIVMGAQSKKWSSELHFVGGLVNVCGNDANAMAERCTVGMRVFHAWKTAEI